MGPAAWTPGLPLGGAAALGSARALHSNAFRKKPRSSQSLNLQCQADLTRLTEGDCSAGSSCPSGATNTMNVGLGNIGQVVVEDVAD